MFELDGIGTKRLLVVYGFRRCSLRDTDADIAQCSTRVNDVLIWHPNLLEIDLVSMLLERPESDNSLPTNDSQRGNATKEIQFLLLLLIAPACLLKRRQNFCSLSHGLPTRSERSDRLL